ncbi:MFS transporter [Micromonospora sp. WMMD1082]|uniref:MDR family MFS transporter n=1 Tax=Micromonospora sp. WMMD1082 TaxID=3016104 RepID=UPI002415D2BE|nr:MFS transporter [Micromonospora sp. WMMD1082]MDG4792746.1 MFS transporter [Micromonospora sp. WMMD1082]
MSDKTPERPLGPLQTLRTLPRPVVVLLAGIAINRMGHFISIFLVLYLIELGFRPAAAGVVLTTLGIGSIIGVFLGGLATDRWGPRRVIIGSMLLSSVAIGVIAFERDYVVLLVTSFVAGLAMQSYRPAASAMLAELTPPERLVMTTAAARLGLNIGATIGPLVGAWLATYSYPMVFLVDAATALAFGMVVLFVLPDTRPARPAATERDRPAPKRDGMLADRRFLLVLGAMFATALAEVQYQAMLPIQLQSDGFPVALYGTIVALNGALVILLELPLTRFVQRLPIRTVIAGGSLLIGLGLSLFGINAGIWILFVGAIVWTMGEIISAPSISAYPALAAPPYLRGRYIGALNTCQTTGYALGPIIGTSLLDYAGSTAWLLCAVLGVIAAAGMWAGIRNDVGGAAPDREVAPPPARREENQVSTEPSST